MEFYERQSGLHSRHELTDLLEIIIIELPELPSFDDGTPVWPWAQLFKAKTEKEFDMLKNNAVVAETALKIMEFSKDEIAQMQYEYELRAELDYNMHIEDAREEGKLDVARAMLADGIPLDKVIKYTGLSVADLEPLK
jgi:predicted transposase/invertase (TIGR01784 family)